MLSVNRYPEIEAVLDSRICLTETQTKYGRKGPHPAKVPKGELMKGRIMGVEGVKLTFGIGTLLPQNCIYVQEAEGGVEYKAKNTTNKRVE